MSLSAREQRILSEIERDLTAAEPLLGRALASMRLGLRDRVAIDRRAHPPQRGGNASMGWVIAMLAVLLAGIAVVSAGLVLDVLAMAIGGAALTQLSLVAGWLARALRPAPFRAGP
jgi:hypothetical protein